MAKRRVKKGDSTNKNAELDDKSKNFIVMLVAIGVILLIGFLVLEFAV